MNLSLKRKPDIHNGYLQSTGNPPVGRVHALEDLQMAHLAHFAKFGGTANNHNSKNVNFLSIIWWLRLYGVIFAVQFHHRNDPMSTLDEELL